MSRWTVTVIAIALTLIVVTAGLSYLSPGKPVEVDAQAQIRDQAMTALAAGYPETMPLMANLWWTGGRQQTGLLGSDVYLYNSGSWRIQLSCPVVPNPIYEISANYSRGDVSVEWYGTYQDGNVTELGCITYGLEYQYEPQEQALYDVTGYIQETHPETAEYFRVTSWSGGLVPNPEGFVGSSTYKYFGIGWNITIKYPVVLDPIYTVNATYANPQSQSGSVIVDWQGTWHNGSVTETSYSYKP